MPYLNLLAYLAASDSTLARLFEKVEPHFFPVVFEWNKVVII
jgi:hypothetical protein